MSQHGELYMAHLRLKAKNEQMRIEFIKLPLYKKVWRILKDRVYMNYLYWFDHNTYIKYKNLGKLVAELNERQLG